MCCFSIPTPKSLAQRLLQQRVRVSKTKIFARMTAPGVQALAYSMNLDSAKDVAMILPLPVRPNSGEDAVRFIDLHAHPRMFDELAALFEEPVLRSMPKSRGLVPQTLKVHKVGSFIATYVPTRFDFDRVDERFWMPRVVFDAVREYADYGFAVFQLEPGNVTVHPMAFTFPTRDIERVFFPTVHLHDGRFHAKADFDHALYYQHPRVVRQGGKFEGDESSFQVPRKDYAGIVDKARPVLRRALHGKLANVDTWIDTGRPITVSSS
jgi:hypothetical protein